MPRAKAPKRNRGYSNKRSGGCEANHDRHPKAGIPWCSLCHRGGRNG